MDSSKKSFKKIEPVIINNYHVIPVKTAYIRPGDSLDILIQNSSPYLDDGDYLIVAETPVSISQKRLIDESKFKPSLTAVLLAEIWSKYIWGYILGPILKIKSRTIKNLRKLPPEARAHKEVVLQHYGIKHALKPASEAGIDLSNVPGSLVSFLPENPPKVALELSQQIKTCCNKKVIVMIIDTDATYKLGNFRFTSLPYAMDGIKSDLGILAYLLGRISKKKFPTPLGSSFPLEIDYALELSAIAEKYQKSIEKNPETIYQMQKTFNKNITEIEVDLLNSRIHTPAVIIKKNY